jgi:hypothetical protein
MGSISLVDQS